MPTLSVLGDNAALDVASTQVLSGVSIALGSPTGSVSAAAVSAGAGGQSGALTLDSDTLTQTDAFATLSGVGSTSTIETTGLVQANFAGGLFSILGLSDFDNEGTVAVQNGDSLAVASNVLNNGTIVDQASATFNGTLDGDGTVSLSDNASVAFDGAVGAEQQIVLADGFIALGDVGGFQGTIANFGSTDVLDIAGETIVSDNYSGGQFVFTDSNAQTYTIALQDTVDPPGPLQTNTDGNGGTFVGSNDNADLPCFAAGTRIATPDGERPVESLSAGDRVLLADGTAADLVWTGHRTVDIARHPRPWRVRPIRIAAGAFGPGLPRRDVFVSPDHAIFLDGVLIPAKLLVDGGAIAQVAWARVAYHHLELASHDILLAEGLPVESYLDAGDRANFFDVGPVFRLFPDFARPKPASVWETRGRAPLVLSGPRLAHARGRVSMGRIFVTPPLGGTFDKPAAFA